MVHVVIKSALVVSPTTVAYIYIYVYIYMIQVSKAPLPQTPTVVVEVGGVIHVVLASRS